MASKTNHLDLLIMDPVADRDTTFNLETMMNENWRKLDAAVIEMDATLRNLIGERAQIVCGSYEGTGTYGADNPNTLNVGFRPKLVIFNKGVYQGNSTSSRMQSTTGPSVFFENGNSVTYLNSNGDATYKANAQIITVTDDGVSWYYEEGTFTFDTKGTPAGQLNESGTTYTYVAIG